VRQREKVKEITMKFFRLSILILALTASALAAPAVTTVSDTLYDQQGNLANGTITITNPLTFTSADGAVITQGARITATVTNGVFSVLLVPNNGSTPSGTSYSVEIQLSSGGGYWRETWIVPSSVPPVGLSGVRASVPVPSVTTQLAASQITPPNPCLPQQVMTWNGTSWICSSRAYIATSGSGYFVGFFIEFPSAITTGVICTGGENRMFQFVLQNPVLVGHASVEITTQGGAGTKYDVGIYSEDKSTLLWHTGAQAADASLGVKTHAATQVLLLPGVYWQGQTSDACGTLQMRLGIGTNAAGGVMNGFAARVGLAGVGGQTLPSSQGTVTASVARWPVLVVFEP
jgi:hypothetical protein